MPAGHEAKVSITISRTWIHPATNLNHLNASVYTDYANYSYREDRNNVDFDTEEVERASETIKYQTLTDSISQEFSRLKTAMS